MALSVLASCSAFEAPLVHTATIALVPPEAAWHDLQSARRQLQDKGLYRWPPHVNLLYPLVPPAHFAEAVDAVAPVLRDFEPFSVTLDSLGVFGGRARGVLYVGPRADDVEKLRALQDALQRALPMCHHQQRDGVFTPHLTLSHFPSADAAEAAKGALAGLSVTFDCDDAVYLMRREGGAGQFERVASLPLGRAHRVDGALVGDRWAGARRFDGMPLVEEDWIRDARRLQKQAQHRPGGRGRRRRRPRRSPEERAAINARTPEEIAAIRAERAEKKRLAALADAPPNPA